MADGGQPGDGAGRGPDLRRVLDRVACGRLACHGFSGALRAGASGFLLKDISADDLLDAVRRVAGGDCLIAPTVGWRLTAEYASARAAREYRLAGSTALETLTPREREVLSCLGRGLSNAEISTRLQMAETTVKTHVSRVLGKLGLRSRTQAAVLARELER